MITGVETTGLVLAVLPLVIEAAKVYSNGVEEIKGVVVPDRHNDLQQQFYEDFWFEVIAINKNIEYVVDSLPGIKDDRKKELKSNMHLEDWTPDNEVAEALRLMFGGEYEFFEMAINKIMRLLGRIVSRSKLELSGAEAVSPDPLNTYMMLHPQFPAQVRCMAV